MLGRTFSMEYEYGLQGFPQEECDKPELLDQMFYAIDKLLGVDGDSARSHINTFYPNGARIYQDCSHVETSLPECKSLTDVIVRDKAFERIMWRAARMVDDEMSYNVFVYKFNMETKRQLRGGRERATYGSHENYSFDKLMFLDNNKDLEGVGDDGLLTMVGQNEWNIDSAKLFSPLTPGLLRNQFSPIEQERLQEIVQSYSPE